MKNCSKKASKSKLKITYNKLFISRQAAAINRKEFELKKELNIYLFIYKLNRLLVIRKLLCLPKLNE
jgi:hypothetical protein